MSIYVDPMDPPMMSVQISADASPWRLDLVLALADPLLGRIDTLVITSPVGTVAVVHGTPAVVPELPTLPGDANRILAYLSVPARCEGITADLITMVPQ